MRFKLILIPLFLLSITCSAEQAPEKNNKGRIYYYWGWNRSWYSNSDIHFRGENYAFKLNDMKALDRPTTFGFDPYFTPSRISIPQTNMRLGFFITENLDISVGVDHMKYVLVYNQSTKIDGFINDGSKFDGVYTNDDFINTYSFLKFEHTDGLNYINIEITRNDNIFKTFNITINPKLIQLNSLIGFGIGGLLPKSNVKLWNNERHDDFHWAGYGFSGKVGLDLILKKYFFFRGEYKVGFIDMPDIRTSINPIDRASQHFFFNQFMFSMGITYNLFN